MDYLWVTVKTLGAIAVMSLLVPLMVWGGTSNWRRAWAAWRSWWLVMGGLALVGCGLAGLGMLLDFMG